MKPDKNAVESVEKTETNEKRTLERPRARTVRTDERAHHPRDGLVMMVKSREKYPQTRRTTREKEDREIGEQGTQPGRQKESIA